MYAYGIILICISCDFSGVFITEAMNRIVNFHTVFV
ncbi:MAG: hypothetical protein ACJAR1_000946 [Rubritalea sp.]|jgi:hypothetical protein